MTSLFAWRYFRSKKSTNAINIISWISVIAIGVVTAALVVVLSVFNGFEDLVKSLYSDFYADIKITKTAGKWMKADKPFLQKVLKVEGVKAVAQIVEERAILMDGEDKSIVWLKGIGPDFAAMSGVPSHIVRGSFETGTKDRPALVVGVGVENALQIAAGQGLFPITAYLPNRLAAHSDDPLEALHSANIAATGSFAIQQEFDNQYAFTNIDFMRYMLDLPASNVSSVEVSILPGTNADDVAQALNAVLGKAFTAKTIYQQNQSLFVAMQVEKLIIYAVAFLILLIAAFNIMSTLSMTVLEKQRDISVLYAMGAPTQAIGSIFLKLGGILAGIGAVSGFIIGFLICKGQQKFHWVKLGGQSFIIDHYPVAMRYLDFLIVAIIIAAIALLAGIFPARKVNRISLALKSA